MKLMLHVVAGTVAVMMMLVAAPSASAAPEGPITSATLEEIRESKRKAELDHADKHDRRQAEETWARTARRQAQADKILSGNRSATADEPMFAGRPVTERLRNARAIGTNAITASEMLTLKQVITGDEPEVATFEFPISYHVLTNLGKMVLIVDPLEDQNADGDCQAVRYECVAATNGNTRLVWYTGYDAPGQHALQASVVALDESTRTWIDIQGPLLPFFSSNLCQYSESSAHFDPSLGATLFARVPEGRADYRVDFISVDGEKLRTLRGSTTNGVIKVAWDLNDEKGQRFSGDAFDSVFHVTLPGSGRSHTQKGP